MGPELVAGNPVIVSTVSPDNSFMGLKVTTLSEQSLTSSDACFENIALLPRPLRERQPRDQLQAASFTIGNAERAHAPGER